MLRHYKSCNDIPVHNFFKVAESKELAYLYLDYDGYGEFELEDGIGEVWSDIYEEYLKLSDGNSAILYYELIHDLLHLESRYTLVSTLLQQLAMGGMSDEMIDIYVLELKKWRYKIDRTKPLDGELSRMVTQLRGSENKIRIKKEEKLKMEEVSEGDKMSLIEQQVKLEQALSRNEIDTKTTVMAKWIAMIKEVKLVNDQKRMNNGK